MIVFNEKNDSNTRIIKKTDGADSNLSPKPCWNKLPIISVLHLTELKK